MHHTLCIVSFTARALAVIPCAHTDCAAGFTSRCQFSQLVNKALITACCNSPTCICDLGKSRVPHALSTPFVLPSFLTPNLAVRWCSRSRDLHAPGTRLVLR